MGRGNRLKTTEVFIILLIIAALSMSWLGQVLSQPYTEVHDKLLDIDKEEKEILEDLFVIIQEIDGMEREGERLALDIEETHKEIKVLENAIEKEEKDHEKNKKGLEQVLKSYQRMGPLSYVEIILNSDNLSIFLQRINTLQDITRNTGKLLDIIEESKRNLLNNKESLKDKLVLVEEKQKQLKETLEKMLKRREDMEGYLISLEGERDYYEKYISDLQKVWNQIAQTLSETIEEVSRIIYEEKLPYDALELRFSLLKVRGTIEEKVFNDLLKEYPQLPEMVFRFLSDKMEIELPDSNVVLRGKLSIVDGKALEFKAEEGTFYGMKLGSSSIDELFKDNRLIINLEPLLYGNKLSDVVIKKGYLELISTLKFLGG